MAVAAGTSHSALVTEDGRLFVWGQDGSGRLGLGQHISTHQAIPREVEDCGERLRAGSGRRQWRMVACGFSHTVAVSEDGACYAWGFGRYGATGSGDEANRVVPSRVLEQHRVAMADAGYYHAGAVTETGDLFMWGVSPLSLMPCVPLWCGSPLCGPFQFDSRGVCTSKLIAGG